MYLFIYNVFTYLGLFTYLFIYGLTNKSFSRLHRMVPNVIH
jgi:hypothetical protein